MLSLSVLLCSACGYQVGDILKDQTIAVPIFHNNTLYRGYEFFLSDALISELLANTSLKVVHSSRAETILYGTITKIRQKTIIKDENRLATNLDVMVEVNIEWKDKSTNKSIIPSTSLSETIEVSVQAGQDLNKAITEALRKLARKVIYQMEHPYWKKNQRNHDKKSK